MNLRVATYLLLLIGLFISPIFFLGQIIEPSQVPRFTFLSIALVFSYFLLLQSESTIVVPKKSFFIPLLLFYLINLQSSFWSLNFAEGFYESQKIVLAIALIIASGQILHSKEKSDAFSWAILFSQIGLVIISISDLILSKNALSTDSLTIFGHKNILSAILFLSIILLGIAFHQIKKKRLLFIVLAILSFGIIIILQTRSVFLALLIDAIILICYSAFKTDWKYKKHVLFGSILLLASVLFLLLFLSHDQTSLAERIELWKKSFLLFQENPLLGVGSGNWQFNYTQFGVTEIPRAHHFNVAFKRPHNDFVSILTEVGIIGFLPIIWIFAVSILSFKKTFSKIEPSLLISVLGLIGLLVFAQFSFPKERISLVFLGSIIFAFFIFKTDSFVKLNVFQSKIISSICLITLILSVTCGYYRLNGEYFTKKAIENQQIGKGLTVIDYSQQAQSIFYTVDPTGTPVVSYEGWGYNEVTDLSGLLKSNEEAVTLCPYNYQTLANYGYILERTFNYKDAEKVLLYAIEINPKYEPTLLNLSVLYFNQADYPQSLKWLIKIEGYKEKYPQNYERIKLGIDESNYP